MAERFIPLAEGQHLIRFYAKTGKRGRPKEEMVAFKIKKVNKDGMVLLENTGPESVPEEIRRSLAKEIVSQIEPMLKQQIGTAVEDSLTRVHKEKLEEIKTKVKNGEEVKIKTRPGCVFLSVGDKEEIQL